MPKTPAVTTKDETIRLRASRADASAWRRAAARARKTLSQWLREIANGAARGSVAMDLVHGLVIATAAGVLALMLARRGHAPVPVPSRADAGIGVGTELLRAAQSANLDEHVSVFAGGAEVGRFHVAASADPPVVRITCDEVGNVAIADNGTMTLTCTPREVAASATAPVLIPNQSGATTTGIGAYAAGNTSIINAGNPSKLATPPWFTGGWKW